MSSPEFGNSAKEKGKYVPGRYTPQARLNMISGALSIIQDLKQTRNIDVVDDVMRDYANYFFPYIQRPIGSPDPRITARCIVHMAVLGFAKYPLYHLYCVLGYLLGEKQFDAITAVIRGRLGRSPRFGNVH